MTDSVKYFNNHDAVPRLLRDVSGAFGDLGVLLPLAVALIARNGMNPTALFLLAGTFYIGSAYYFRITMPVQPLKAMSAIAISAGLGFAVINAAGLVMGIILLLITATGVSVRLGAIFPASVIRGIQLGLGLMLVKSSVGLINTDTTMAALAVAIVIADLVLFRKVPPLIPVLLLGTVIAMKNANATASGPVPMRLALPDVGTLWRGFTLLVLPQLALTFGNAVVATEATAKLLYGDRARRLNLRSIPLSMGLANILSGVAGGAPMCHGCGGLTAHNKFGATSERSGYIIGSALIFLALVLGRSALAVVAAFPPALLGLLLCAVGVQHSLFIRDILADRAALLIALAVAFSAVLTNNLSLGFLLGLSIHYSLVFMKNVVRA